MTLAFGQNPELEKFPGATFSSEKQHRFPCKKSTLGETKQDKAATTKNPIHCLGTTNACASSSFWKAIVQGVREGAREPLGALHDGEGMAAQLRARSCSAQRALRGQREGVAPWAQLPRQPSAALLEDKVILVPKKAHGLSVSSTPPQADWRQPIWYRHPETHF